MIYQNPALESSYRPLDLGRTLYDIVLRLKPKVIFEFGVLNGYSTVAMAMALHEIGSGHIFAYDLWDKYRYKHGDKEQVLRTIKKLGLAEFVQLCDGDFYDWVPENFDLMHVDISNDGKTLRHISRLLQAKPHGRILFEGGTRERDNVAWMIKYEKEPMTLSNLPYRVINSNFPGLSMATLFDPVVRL